MVASNEEQIFIFKLPIVLAFQSIHYFMGLNVGRMQVRLTEQILAKYIYYEIQPIKAIPA